MAPLFRRSHLSFYTPAYMEKNMNLDNRLSAVAAMVSDGGVFADCGTDHAYIPIYLIKNGISQRGYASDINKGPLNSAKTNIENEGLGDKIQTVLTDGLDGYNDTAITDIIIAGMGGELIMKIIDRSALVRTAKPYLILQPMSHEDKLRVYLNSHGFETSDERIVSEGDKLYVVIKAKYTGEALPTDGIFKYIGNLDLSADTSRKYLKKKLAALGKKIKGLESGGKYAKQAEILKSEMKSLQKISEESENNE